MKYIVFFLVFFWPLYLSAQDIPFSDAAKEEQARILFYELRCAVCNGQTIADSNADLAADMRGLVRQKLSAGESPDAIRRYFADRYGEEILMRPPVSSRTLPLWLLPLLFLITGIFCCYRYFRRLASHI